MHTRVTPLETMTGERAWFLKELHRCNWDLTLKTWVTRAEFGLQEPLLFARTCDEAQARKIPARPPEPESLQGDQLSLLSFYVWNWTNFTWSHWDTWTWNPSIQSPFRLELHYQEIYESNLDKSEPFNFARVHVNGKLYISAKCPFWIKGIQTCNILSCLSSIFMNMGPGPSIGDYLRHGALSVQQTPWKVLMQLENGSCAKKYS